MKMHIVESNICTALNATGVIGTKVTDKDKFMDAVARGVEAHDFTQDRIPGQAYIQVPAVPFVSAGVGKKTPRPQDYVLREHRGQVHAYLKREFAARVDGCAVVVYTKDAYLRDPDVTREEIQRIENIGYSNPLGFPDPPRWVCTVTHVLVAVLASAGPRSQLSPYRFTANLAGGNKEALVWTADEIRAKAREIMTYENEWSTVADDSV
jgi:hypothetical protein